MLSTKGHLCSSFRREAPFVERFNVLRHSVNEPGGKVLKDQLKLTLIMWMSFNWIAQLNCVKQFLLEYGYSFVAKLSWKKNIFFEKAFKKIYISFQKYIFTQKMFVLQIKYFLNIYSFCKKNFLIIENIFVKTSKHICNLVLKVLEAANLRYSLN